MKIAFADLARAVAAAVGYTGRIRFDTAKPDRAPRKWMDSTRLGLLGWQPSVALEQGLRLAYADFCQNPPLAPVIIGDSAPKKIVTTP